MSRTELVVANVQRQTRDRYMARLEQPDALPRSTSAAIALACFAVVAVTLWVCL